MALQYDGCGNYSHSSVCYIHVRTMNGSEFVPVKHARPYKNSYNLDLFVVTKDIFSSDNKRQLSSAGSIVDGMSGYKLCNLEDFESIIEKHGLNQVKDKIYSTVERFGWSPRYLRPNEKKSDVFPKEEADEEDKCILVTPLFVDGMYNRIGKRMRAKFVKTVKCDAASYDLYISGSKTPENNYPYDETDKYYLHVWMNGWLIPIGMTERFLRQHSARKYVVARLYGSEDDREAFFNDLRKNHSDYEIGQLVGQQVKKEDELEAELSHDGKYMAEYIKTVLDNHVKTYTDCKVGVGNFPDFIGAAIMNELENCVRLSDIKKKNDEAEHRRRLLEKAEKERQEAEAAAKKEAEELAAVEEIMRSGGIITDGSMICALADKYNVSIPIRTRGWILNTFARCEIKGDEIAISFWKKKNGTGSTRIYEIIRNIRSAVIETQAEN